MRHVYEALAASLERGEGALCLKRFTRGKAYPEVQVSDLAEAPGPGPKAWEETEDGAVLAQAFRPKPRLIVLGGGHISKALVYFAAKLDFHVTVWDDRPSFANKARFPEAQEVLCEYFEKVFARLSLTPSTYVAILTRGHKHDKECFRSLAGKPLAYLGMVGSKRRIAGLKEEARAEGVAEEALEALHAPIGLDIGAVTPDEIALSILAQIVAVRRGLQARQGQAKGWEEFDQEVLRELARPSQEPRALVTVVATKGSVPRGPGAAMIVWLDGRILGSIGGGCSEGEVIVLARDQIRQRSWLVHQVDMTGAVAEDEGMVCGGIMEVLIEALPLKDEA